MKFLPLGLISAGLLFAQTEERAIIPQIADGGGWKTRVVIVNRSLSLAARPILNFFGQNGAPLAFSVLGAGMVSNLERTIPPGGSLIVETAGLQPEVQAGWVQIRSGSPAVPGDYMTPGLPATSPVLAFVSFRQRVPGAAGLRGVGDEFSSRDAIRGVRARQHGELRDVGGGGQHAAQ
jgi:hypothetical protein